jgi:hypothetical protein
MNISVETFHTFTETPDFEDVSDQASFIVNHMN